MPFPFYIAVESEQAHMEDIRCLTPKVMRWQPRLWLLDLRPTYSYWRKRARRQGQPWLELISHLLQEIGGENHRAACSSHPFQALLLCQVLREKGLTGFLNHSSPFGLALYKQMTWACFWQVGEQSLDHFINFGCKKGHISQYPRDQRLMQSALARLQLNTPQQLLHTDTSSIQRRFGVLMSQLWEWAFKEEGQNYPDSFPFMPHHFQESPVVERSLDFPLMGWEHLEPLLHQDLGRLCSHNSYTAGDLVTGLEWRVNLQDLSCLDIPILFRHPYDLRKDSPHYPIALLQAYYSFIDVSQEHLKSYEDADIPPPPVISWELKITGLMPQKQKIFDLFQEESLDQDELERLENLLPLPLKEYSTADDWCPEGAYFDQMQTPQIEINHDEARGCQKALNSIRPPFIYRRPSPLKSSGSSLKRFLERTMDKWWLNPEQNIQRDYYLMIDAQNRHLWVYQDQKGNWHTHGIFA